MKKMTNSKMISYLVIVSLLLTIFLAPLRVYATDDYYKGYQAGERAAEGQISKGTWMALGFFFGLWGVLGAYVGNGHERKANSAVAMLGENYSDEYKRGFRDGFINKAKNIRGKNALIGCGIGIGLYLLMLGASSGSSSS